MDDMRIVFLVIGSIAIAALMVHGFYTVQRNKPKPKNRRVASSNTKRPAARVAPELEPEPTAAPMSAVDSEPTDAANIDSKLEAGTYASVEPNIEQSFSTNPDAQPAPQSVSKVIAESAQQSLLQEEIAPIPEAQEKVNRPRAPQKREPKLDTEQIEFDLEPSQPLGQATAAADLPTEPAPVFKEMPEQPPVQMREEQQPLSFESTAAPEPMAQPEPEMKVDSEPSDVLVLYVVGKNGTSIRGEDLMPSLTKMNFKYGDMEIFHRHQHSNGTGPVLYSLANMLQPGTFDLDAMEQFTTDGVLLFLTLPTNNDARVAFSMMLGNAQCLADMHDGEVLNDQRQPWDEMAQEGYLQRIQTAESLATA